MPNPFNTIQTIPDAGFLLQMLESLKAKTPTEHTIKTVGNLFALAAFSFCGVNAYKAETDFGPLAWILSGLASAAIVKVTSSAAVVCSRIFFDSTEVTITEKADLNPA